MKKLNDIVKEHLFEMKSRLLLLSRFPTLQEVDRLITYLREDGIELSSFLVKEGITLPIVDEQEIRLLVRSYSDIAKRVQTEEALEILKRENPKLCSDMFRRNS
jgi:hypothetical protein